MWIDGWIVSPSGEDVKQVLFTSICISTIVYLSKYILIMRRRPRSYRFPPHYKKLGSCCRGVGSNRVVETRPGEKKP